MATSKCNKCDRYADSSDYSYEHEAHVMCLDDDEYAEYEEYEKHETEMHFTKGAIA